MSANTYPPIADYGFIADSHSCALISRSASIDWCCMPRMDSPSCFGRILDWDNGGYCQIVPEEKYRISRRYLESSMVLETTFSTRNGEARILDCSYHAHGRSTSIRTSRFFGSIEGVKGSGRTQDRRRTSFRLWRSQAMDSQRFQREFPRHWRQPRAGHFRQRESGAADIGTI